MYKIAVSPEELDAFGDRIEKFKQSILLECDLLKQQTEGIKACVDDSTGLALARPVQEIARIISDTDESLKNIAESARAYAGTVRNMQEMIERRRNHKNNLKEVAAGMVMASMLTDPEDIKNGLKLVGTAVEGIELISDIRIPPTEPILDVLDCVFDMRYDNVEPSSVPPEQIESHTLVLDDPDDPWKTTE